MPEGTFPVHLRIYIPFINSEIRDNDFFQSFYNEF